MSQHHPSHHASHGSYRNLSTYPPSSSHSSHAGGKYSNNTGYRDGYNRDGYNRVDDSNTPLLPSPQSPPNFLQNSLHSISRVTRLRPPYSLISTLPPAKQTSLLLTLLLLPLLMAATVSLEKIAFTDAIPLSLATLGALTAANLCAQLLLLLAVKGVAYLTRKPPPKKASSSAMASYTQHTQRLHTPPSALNLLALALPKLLADILHYLSLPGLPFVLVPVIRCVVNDIMDTVWDMRYPEADDDEDVVLDDDKEHDLHNHHKHHKEQLSPPSSSSSSSNARKVKVTNATIFSLALLSSSLLLSLAPSLITFLSSSTITTTTSTATTTNGSKYQGVCTVVFILAQFLSFGEDKLSNRVLTQHNAPIDTKILHLHVTSLRFVALCILSPVLLLLQRYILLFSGDYQATKPFYDIHRIVDRAKDLNQCIIHGEDFEESSLDLLPDYLQPTCGYIKYYILIITVLTAILPYSMKVVVKTSMTLQNLYPSKNGRFISSFINRTTTVSLLLSVSILSITELTLGGGYDAITHAMHYGAVAGCWIGREIKEGGGVEGWETVEEEVGEDEEEEEEEEDNV
jgi:hypothetical protein